jgi:hypothetical protein
MDKMEHKLFIIKVARNRKGALRNVTPALDCKSRQSNALLTAML